MEPSIPPCRGNRATVMPATPQAPVAPMRLGRVTAYSSARRATHARRTKETWRELSPDTRRGHSPDVPRRSGGSPTHPGFSPACRGDRVPQRVGGRAHVRHDAGPGAGRAAHLRGGGDRPLATGGGWGGGRRLCAEPEVRGKGGFYRPETASLHRGPRQTPPPPLWFGGHH